MIKIENRVIDLKRFPDGTLAPCIPENLMLTLDRSIMISWFYDSDGELPALFYLARHFQSKGHRLNLYMPYCPNARMDRMKNYSDIFTLKHFAELINSIGFEQIIAVDIHSNVGAALFNNFAHRDAKAMINAALFELVKSRVEDVLIFYPDEGSVKRYSEMIKRPYAYGIKYRDWETGKILGLDVVDNGEQMGGRSVLIVDDICSRGGTFYHAAKKLKELGAGNIYLYITHCENTILEGELINSGLIKRIFTTDSIFTKQHELIQIIWSERK